ncbi:MAG: redoxin domain-containing protein [bacterium]|nr:MAG: redoxin domain-containing protein [bacterium]
MLVTLLLGGDPSLFGDAHGEVVFRSSRGMSEGDTFAPRTLRTISDEKVDIPAGEGLTVILFWATWSPRSKSALQMWERYSTEYAEHPVTVISVNADNQRMDASDLKRIDDFVRENDIALPVIIDFNLELFNEIGIVVNPTTLFLDDKGVLVYKLASFPSSAALDLKEELEIRLGLRERETDQERAARGKLDYQPKNNALLYYNMAINLWKKGFTEKAKDRLVMALQRDPDYGHPLRALEGIYLANGTTPESEQELREFLTERDLADLVDRIGQGEPFIVRTEKRTDPMEKLRQLVGGGTIPGTDREGGDDDGPPVNMPDEGKTVK